METTPQKFYRYEYSTYDGYNIFALKTDITLREYDLIKETLKGYWIGYANNRNQKVAWIAKVGKKKYAYATKEEAFTNLRLRTKRRLGFLTTQVNRCESAISAIEKYDIKEKEHNTLK